MKSINCRVVSPIEEPPSPKVELMTSRTSLLDAADSIPAPTNVVLLAGFGWPRKDATRPPPLNILRRVSCPSFVEPNAVCALKLQPLIDGQHK